MFYNEHQKPKGVGILRVLGIDPGLATMGYGVVDTDGRKPVLVAAGAVITTPDMRMFDRLHKIYADVRDLLTLYKPDDIAFEELFFARNVTTALNVGAGAVDPTADALIIGEMGIGNSTIAAALAAAIYGGTAKDFVGPGTGSDAAGIAQAVLCPAHPI